MVPEPLAHDRRDQGIDLLRHLVSLGKLDLASFDAALDRMISAATEAEFSDIVKSLPAPINMTPPERRLTEPLAIKTVTQNIHLTGRWQLARDTTVSTATGSITIDLTEAEFDDRQCHARDTERHGRPAGRPDGGRQGGCRCAASGLSPHPAHGECRHRKGSSAASQVAAASVVAAE
jgi:hypothetical protein